PAAIQTFIATANGPKPPPLFTTDGATHAPNWLLIPPGIWVFTIGPAACHDWCYDPACEEIPNTAVGKAMSDMILWQNMMKLAAPGWNEEQLAVLRAGADAFFYAVQEFAQGHFKVPPSRLPGWTPQS